MNKKKAGWLPTKKLRNLDSYPGEQRLEKGAVAVIECPEEIPCNVCVAVCPFEAIIIEDEIKNLPKLDTNRCKGCGLCVAKCPGLAIFTIDNTYSNDTALLSFPYEFDPLPKEGSTVNALNRAGEVVIEVKVIDAKLTEDNDKTAIISIAVPKEYIHEVRGIGLNCISRDKDEKK